MAKTKIRIKGINGKVHTAQTVLPARKPGGHSGKKYRTPQAEFRAEYIDSKQHKIAGGTRKKFHQALNKVGEYMRTREGLSSFAQIKRPHVDRLVAHLKSTVSVHTGRPLSDKYIKDILGEFRKVLVILGKEYMMRSYESYGLNVKREHLERPIKFPEGWEAQRAAFQEKMEQRAEWIGVASQLGLAFGLREQERLLSRDIIIKVDGKYQATYKCCQFKPVTVRQLTQRYGATFRDRLTRMEEGKQYLIVEGAKGGRNRPVLIYNESRREAIERVRKFIVDHKAEHRQHMSLIPLGLSLEQGLRRYTDAQEHCGGTRENLLHSHADRHYDAQKLKAEGWSSTDIVEDKGHSDPRKINYYIP